MDYIEPGYLELYRTGELSQRSEELLSHLESCDICPHKCMVNRVENQTGFCHSGNKPIVSSVCAHHGEEPPISGSRGSGTIFFGNCNMQCVYCQNYQISQEWKTQKNFEVAIIDLAGKMLYLQNRLHCHNINLVTPSHFVPQIFKALEMAIPEGLHLPLVYNTSGYDSLETLKLLDGVISVYLPDLRYADNDCGKQYSGVPDYVERARTGIREMYHQVGRLILDDEGVVQRGIIVRHLILPGNIAGSKESLTWLADAVSPDVAVSLMSQYYPAHVAYQFPELNRRITYEEYTEVTELMHQLGLENGWMQQMEAADSYRPDFTVNGHPFETVT